MHHLQILNRNVSDVMLGHRQRSVSHRVLKIGDVPPVLDVRSGEFPSEGMEAMVNVVFGQTDFAEHIHEIPHCVSVGEMSSVESAKEELGIKLCLTVIGHI